MLFSPEVSQVRLCSGPLCSQQRKPVSGISKATDLSTGQSLCSSFSPVPCSVHLSSGFAL